MLKQQQIADADLDAWYLLAHVFHINRTDYLLHGDKTAPEEGSLQYGKLVKMRAEHVPLQHITGTQEFMGLEFSVTGDVLIPRQDTELLAEEVLHYCDGKSVLDMCTGSGCIIISTAVLGKPAKLTAADISQEALQVAKENADKHGVNIEFILSDLFENIKESYDIIVSNPPYIPSKEINELMPEVKDHEPWIALDGSPDGLYFYGKIARDSKKHLKPNGMMLFEIGYNQGKDVAEILQKEGFVDILVKKDLSGLDRVVTAKRSF
jgi:release factor glutamine methyltransferase